MEEEVGKGRIWTSIWTSQSLQIHQGVVKQTVPHPYHEKCTEVYTAALPSYWIWVAAEMSAFGQSAYGQLRQIRRRWSWRLCADYTCSWQKVLLQRGISLCIPEFATKTQTTASEIFKLQRLSPWRCLNIFKSLLSFNN